MHIVDGKIPFGFIAHPRTGSQSTRIALTQQLSARTAGGHHGIDEAEIDGILDAGGVVCSTIRNPFDVVASWYFYTHENVKRHANLPVEKFNDWLYRLITEGDRWVKKRWLDNGLFFGTKHCNWIISYENDIQSQLNTLLRYCSLPEVTLLHSGATERAPYQTLYSSDSIELAQRYFEDELEEWSYSF